MRARNCNPLFVSALLNLSVASLLLLSTTRPALAIDAKKPRPTLADTIQQSQIPREQFYGEVKLLHAPNISDIQFSQDGSVLFSLSETVRLWRSDTGAYLGSIAGPERFTDFALLNHSRWIVTLDQWDPYWERSLYAGVPQVLPRLRMWDVMTGNCLGVRDLKLPINASSIALSRLETADALQMTWIILDYDLAGPEEDFFYGNTKSSYQKLLGFQGSKLTPICRKELDQFSIRHISPPEALNWDPYTSRLYLHGEYSVSSFDPVSKQIKLLSVPGNSEKGQRCLLDLFVIAPTPGINPTASEKKKYTSSLLVTFAFSSFQKSKGNKNSILLEWVLIAPNSGKTLRSGIVNRDELKPAERKPEQQHRESLVHWIYDSQDHSFKAIDLLNNQLLRTIHPGHNGYAKAGILSADSLWNLIRFRVDTETEKLIWSPAADRICYIGGGGDIIGLFDSKTGKRVAASTGTVTAMSAVSDHHLAAAFDWNTVSVFQVTPQVQVARTFSGTMPGNTCVALSSDARALLVGKDSGRAEIWSLPQNKNITTFGGVFERLVCIEVDAVQNQVIAGDRQGMFWRWNVPQELKSALRDTLFHETAPIKNPEKLSQQKAPQDITLNASLCTLSPHAALAISFQPLGDDFMDYDEDSGSTPGVSLITNLGSEFWEGEIIAIRNSKAPFTLTPAVPHRSVLTRIKCSADSYYALLVFDTGQITILNLQDGTQESIIQTGNREIVDIDFQPAQHTLLVASYRGAVTAWNTETFLKTGSLQLYDSRLNFLSSRVAKQGFDLILGTRDTGLIVKHGVFPAAERQGQKPPALNIPFNPDNQ
ncbi:MAG: hypothetical protein ACIAZJ_11250 [Gimesia chilikensis]|uniref:hypothetical protein n=1 Tax=Gimesia chilikensis TaxID=2605989 RepID=UPI003798A386